MALTFGTLLSSQRTNTHHHKPLRSGPLLWPAPGQLVQLTVLPVRRQLARRALHRARLMGHHEGLQLAGELRGRCPASPWLPYDTDDATEQPRSMSITSPRSAPGRAMRLSSAHSAATLDCWGAQPGQRPGNRAALVGHLHPGTRRPAPGCDRVGTAVGPTNRRSTSNTTTGNNNKGAPGWLGAPLLLLGLCSAVSYSPTPWRVQYHRRWRA
jgi:hypothetical protein